MAHEPRGWTPLGGQQLFQPPPPQQQPIVPGASMGTFPGLRLLPSPPSLFSSPQLNGRQMLAPPALEAAGMLLDTRTGARGTDSQSMTGNAVQPGMAIVPAQYRQQQYMSDPTLSPFRQPQQQPPQPLRVNNKRQRPVNSEQGAVWHSNQVQAPPRLYQQPQRQQLQQQAQFHTQQQPQQIRNSVQMQQQPHNPQRQQQHSRQQYLQQQLRAQTPQPQMQQESQRIQQQQFQIHQQQELQRLQQQLQLQRQQQQQQQLQKEEQRQLQLRRQEQQQQHQELQRKQQQHRLFQQEQLQRQQQQLQMDQEQQDRVEAHFGSRIWSNEQHQSRAASAIDAHFQPQPVQTQHFRAFPSLIESEISPQSFGNTGMFQPQQRTSQHQQQFQSFAPLTDRSMIQQQQQQRSPMAISYDAHFQQQNGLVFNGNQSVMNQASPHLQGNRVAPQEMQWSTNEATTAPVSFTSPESRLTGSFRIDELLSAASAMDDPLSPSHYYSAQGRASSTNREQQASEIPPWPLLNTTLKTSSFSKSPTWQNPQASTFNLPPSAEIMQRTTIPSVLQASVAISRLQEQRKTPQDDTSEKAKPKPRPRLLKKAASADQPPIPSSPDWVVPAGPGGYFPFGNALQIPQTVDTPVNNRMRIESLLEMRREPAKGKTKAKPRTKKQKQPPPVAPIASSITTPTTSLDPVPPPVISPANDQPPVADLSKQAPIPVPRSVQQVAQEPTPITQETSRPPAVNPTVMIFCRRDFMRYQAAKLWKKYEEKKKKRGLVSVRTTGKRRRYLSSRHEEATPITQV